MIPPKTLKGLFLSVSMVITAAAFWIGDGSGMMWDPVEVFCAFLMVAGALCVARISKDSLRDALAVSSMIIGVYLVLKSISGFELDDNSMFMLDLGLSISGLAVIFFGFALFAGVEYNVLRIRFLSSAVLAVVLMYLFSQFTMNPDIVSWFSDSYMPIIVGIQSLSILIVSLERTLGAYGTMDSIEASMGSLSERMLTMSDAYVLREDAERLASALGKDGSAETATLRSCSFGSRRIRASSADGHASVDIIPVDSVYDDPIVSMESVSASLSEKEIVFYGVDGRRIRLLVFDGIQEDPANPKILGRELDPRNLGSWIRGKLERGNSDVGLRKTN